MERQGITNDSKWRWFYITKGEMKAIKSHLDCDMVNKIKARKFLAWLSRVN